MPSLGLKQPDMGGENLLRVGKGRHEVNASQAWTWKKLCSGHPSRWLHPEARSCWLVWNGGSEGGQTILIAHCSVHSGWIKVAEN